MLAVVCWKVGVGGWRLDVGCWRLDVESWKVDVGLRTFGDVVWTWTLDLRCCKLLDVL